MPIHRTYKPSPLKPVPAHSVYINDWIHWRESGLHRRKWAPTYKVLQLLYIDKYFKLYQYVTPENIEQWLSEVPIESRSKRKHMHSVASSFADFLQSKELISREDYLKIRLLHPKKSHYLKPKQNIISKEELKTIIFQAATGHHRYQATLNFTLIVFLSQTALRVSEAANLSISDIHFGNAEKSISPSITVRCGKGGKSRKVPFSRMAQEVILDYLKVRPDSTRYDNLFLAFNPKHGFTPISKDCVARRFRLLRQKTGIKFTAHSLRHFRITDWANNPKYPIAYVQKWAGHSSLAMTQHYIHIDEDESLKLGCE